MQVRSGAISTAAATAARTDSSSVTSASQNRPPSSAATALPLAASRSTTTTRAPSAARRRLVASPIPDAAPVTSAEVLWSVMAGAAYRMLSMVPYPRRLADLATADPDRPAITDEHRTVTRAELEA